MKNFTLIFVVFISVLLQEISSIAVSPCKVRNVFTQPTHGTLLKTKGFVQIIQMPPVFVQNVMIGTCDTSAQNISLGMSGQYFSCEQRYSTVEVYVIGQTIPTLEKIDHGQNHQQHPQAHSQVNFVRESVIIESGCEFKLNILPILAMGGPHHDHGPTDPHHQPPTMLRSPYHPTFPAVARAGELEFEVDSNANVENTIR